MDRVAGLTADMATALRAGIGPERLSGYDLASGGDQLRALHLYQWTTAVNGAVFEDLSMPEVVLRNACHHQLQR